MAALKRDEVVDFDAELENKRDLELEATTSLSMKSKQKAVIIEDAQIIEETEVHRTEQKKH